MGLFDRPKAKPKRAADRRAGPVPHVGKVPRSRNKDGTWRKKSSLAGKPRPKKKKGLRRLLG